MTRGNDGWYSVEIPTGYPNMLVNGSNGGMQTGDIKGVDITKDVWIVVNNDKSTMVFDSKPSASVLPGNTPVKPAVLESLALVGEGIPGVGTWIVEDPAGDMIKGSGNVYTKEVALIAGTTMQFKIAGNDSWDSGYNYGGAEEGVVVTLGNSLDLASGGDSKNLTLTVDKNCTVKFTVTLKNNTASLLVEEVAGSAGGDVEPPVSAGLSSLALVGEGIPGVGTWMVDDPAGDMTMEFEGVYTKQIVVTAGTTMKFKVAGNDNWDSGYNYGGASDGVAVTLGATLVLASGAESKDLTLTADKDCTLKFTVTLVDGDAILLVEEVADSATTDPEPTEPAGNDGSKPTDPEPTEPAGNDGPKPTNSFIVYAVIGAAVVAAVVIAAVVFIVLKKKR
jgi:hypothetical protein